MKTTCTLAALAAGLKRAHILALLGFLSSTAASAQTTPAFPRNEPFKSGSATNFTFGGTARLTGTGGTGNDAVGQGYLRLTDALTNQAGYAIDNIGFPAGAGFTISFEFFSYGRTTADGADGFSVFLVDANQPSGGFRIGASGGSLGYAQKTIDPVSAGVTKGYIGIGIDEFGNYSAGTEGRSGGSPTVDASGRVPNGVAIRGAGNGSASTDYPYLTGTTPGALGFTLDVPTTRAQAGAADYRRAYIDVVPTTAGSTTTYRITVRIQHGNAVYTAINNFQVATPPQNLRLGFAGATGGSTNVHEIRNLNLVQVPFAADDAATTAYNAAVTVPILSNDVAPGSNIDPATVDLDPNTAGVQASLAVPGKGTFAVNSSGVVTFTPSGSFAGTVVAPYTVQSVLRGDYTSSPANISVTVQGADVATTVSGPTSATAGSLITYAMRTANAGGLTATSVVPKLQLPAGLPTANVTATGGSYDPASGWVTFGQINSLSATATPVDNTVTFRAPTTGPVDGLATAASSAVPDPVDTNNSATVTTAIGAAPLPVTLTDFTVRAQGADALLIWHTAQEKNNDRFEVERSGTGRDFERVGTLPGRGNATTVSEYRYSDPGAARYAAGTLYYRLRQVDTDGTATYSEVRAVQFDAKAMPAVVTLYPNPAAEQATLDLSRLPAARYAVRILDLTGRLVQEQAVSGGSQPALSLRTLRPGAYVVQVRGAGRVVSLPLVRY
ncbi:T9SS type A sorting domain-containing protein [Hymenobacter jeollabukensis]|uniref:T9SS type A sorting domain-containing protein n=1 Tax=Hymenobacter jeollabukensis TaxID=2025313 RepID=A0A5R8WSZ9_9BACT|nr:T9SS type A sorting domain-containing protein [Hymenobacter jeollabukensis]TLM93927.1 T9SS type A sorting domain-containing protein [Hymenobacter jeollabukensis]